MENKVSAVLLTQIEEALEERQNRDRRKEEQELPEGVADDRRKLDRRAAKKLETA